MRNLDFLPDSYTGRSTLPYRYTEPPLKPENMPVSTRLGWTLIARAIHLVGEGGEDIQPTLPSECKPLPLVQGHAKVVQIFFTNLYFGAAN